MVRACLLLCCVAGCDRTSDGVVGHDGETDGADSEVEDSDLDTDAVGTDRPADTDVAIDTDVVDDSDTSLDTDLLADSDVAADTDTGSGPAPILFGRGFVDLTTALYAASPRETVTADFTLNTPAIQTGGLIADLDGDGRNEVVLTGTAPAGSGVPPVSWVLRYDPLTESLVPDAALTDALLSTAPLLGAMWDIDGDGHPDGAAGQLPYSGVRWGAAGATWGDPVPTYGALVGDHSVQLGIADLDNDGWLDLVRPFGGCDPTGESFSPELQTAPRRFESRPNRIDGQDNVNPFVVGAGPLLGSAPMVMSLGGPCPSSVDGPGFFSISGTDAEGFPLYVGLDPTPSTALYKQDPAVAGRSVSWLQPMGAAIADLDRDGRPDLTLTTTTNRLLIFGDVGGPTLVDRSYDWDATLPPRTTSDTGLGVPRPVMRPWGVIAADVDRDGRNDLIVATGDDATDSYDSLVGGYRPTLYMRRGTAFVESALSAGLTLPTDGQTLAAGDLDGDGAVDLVFGGAGELPRVYLNRMDATPPGLAVRLMGTSSNPLGIGAWLQGTDDGVAFDASVMGGIVSRGPLSEPLVFLAAGADGVLDTLTIRWPSGHEQVVHDLTAGSVHTITEPVTLSVLDADRHAPADGVSSIALSMTPRAPDGTPRAGSVVTFRLVAGTGTWVGSPSVAVATTTQALLAPSSPGWAIVEISVDGVVQPARPHLWWDAVP